VAQQEVKVEVKDHLRAGDFSGTFCYIQSRPDSEPEGQATNASVHRPADSSLVVGQACMARDTSRASGRADVDSRPMRDPRPKSTGPVRTGGPVQMRCGHVLRRS